MSQELMIQVGANLAGLLVGGAVLYGRVQADINHALLSVDRLHKRIDEMMLRASRGEL